MLAPFELKGFLGVFPWVICQVEEDSSCHVFILVWYTSSHRSVFNKCVCSGDSLCERGYKQVTLTPADKQPCIKLFHAEVDVIMFATKRVDPKDVTRH